MSTSTRTLVLLSGLAAVGTLSTTIILPSFPAMAASLNAAPADMALTLSSLPPSVVSLRMSGRLDREAR